jgi:hypothetical protein
MFVVIVNRRAGLGFRLGTPCARENACAVVPTGIASPTSRGRTLSSVNMPPISISRTVPAHRHGVFSSPFTCPTQVRVVLEHAALTLRIARQVLAHALFSALLHTHRIGQRCYRIHGVV